MNIQSFDLPSLFAAFFTVLFVVIPCLLIIFFPTPTTIWKWFHPVRQEDMPEKVWYKVRGYRQGKKKIILDLNVDRPSPHNRRLFCILRNDENPRVQEILLLRLSEVGRTKDVCVIFLREEDQETEKICYRIDFSTSGFACIPHMIWRQSNY